MTHFDLRRLIPEDQSITDWEGVEWTIPGALRSQTVVEGIAARAAVSSAERRQFELVDRRVDLSKEYAGKTDDESLDELRKATRELDDDEEKAELGYTKAVEQMREWVMRVLKRANPKLPDDQDFSVTELTAIVHIAVSGGEQETDESGAETGKPKDTDDTITETLTGKTQDELALEADERKKKAEEAGEDPSDPPKPKPKRRASRSSRTSRERSPARSST